VALTSIVINVRALIVDIDRAHGKLDGWFSLRRLGTILPCFLFGGCNDARCRRYLYSFGVYQGKSL
jgi:hypothetical protein